MMVAFFLWGSLSSSFVFKEYRSGNTGYKLFSIRQSQRCRCLDEGAAGRPVYDKERVLVDPPKAVIFLKAASG